MRPSKRVLCLSAVIALEACDEEGSTVPTGTTGSSDESGGPMLPAGGCDATVFPTEASDIARLSEPGPWPVGVRTVDIAGRRVEVWYPAASAGEPATYDIRELLPASERGKIPDEANPIQRCDCSRDVEVVSDSGRFPVVVFVHGTAGYRSQSLPQVTHWASWGFVVLAADHPGLSMTDLLGVICGEPDVPQDIRADIDLMLAAARGDEAGLEFIRPFIDATRVGISGHSAGGRAIARMAGVAQVLIPMAAGGTDFTVPGASTLVLGGTADSVVAFDQQLEGYASSRPPKRLVGIENAGHLAFSEICSLRNDDGQSLLEVAQTYDVCGAAFAASYFQCSDALTPDAVSWPIINAASTGVLLETLHCQNVAGAMRTLPGAFPQISHYEELLE